MSGTQPQKWYHHNKRVFDDLKPGDRVQIKKTLYSHWAVSIGDGEIAHLVGADDDDQIDTPFNLKLKFTICGKTFNKVKVCIDDFWDVVGEHKAFINNCDDKFSPMETSRILERANDSIGLVGYNVIYSNCEHFATWCRYDVCESSQVNRFVPVAICVAGISISIGIIFDITSKREYLKRLISWIYESSNVFAALSLIIIYPILGYLVYRPTSLRIAQPSTAENNQESEVSITSGSKLDKYLNDCKKYPGHTQFIPVDTFTLKHLPKDYRDNDLYELIKATADLTVRVDVKMISPHRPEFWPKVKVSYPFYNMRDKTNLRYGSGLVSEVDKFTDGDSDAYGGKHWKNYTTCWCKQCHHTDTASHVWWEFDVYTVTHVVFDDIEASHTSLRLFYDREDSPVVSVDQVSVVDVDIESDICGLKCVTCDKKLADKLNMLWRHYKYVSRIVFDKYWESRDVDKLNFIVSHPHGCSKQVSVGHWVDRYKVDNDLKRFTYTTSTCPGSGGAAVHCVGYSHPLVHSETLNSKLNCSGAGLCY